MMNVLSANFSPSPFVFFPGTQYTYCVNYYIYYIYHIMFCIDLLLYLPVLSTRLWNL